ncbi:hypothetical protein F5Y01DRAFT_294873 [Xylaria sp. FL0043]|nr:hypothetical protein F5Y01DRAFT_294873 [Xylaria sp. FL0043]
MNPLDRYPEATDGPIPFERCRHCAGVFEYKLEESSVNILLGVPRDTEYCALSYVWGEVRRYTLLCRGCDRATIAPLASIDKFRNLARLGLASCSKATGPPKSANIWLDAISIDQTSEDDISRCIGAMGEIYERALTVAVLLPSEDSEAFHHFRNLASNAVVVVLNRNAFSRNDEVQSTSGYDLSRACQSFWSLLVSLEAQISEWSYWKRAWTFQEWALATDICIGIENREVEVTCGCIPNIKSLVWGVGYVLAAYKLKWHQYANINQGFSRAEVAARFEIVKRIFPNADVIRQYDEAPSEQDQMLAAMFTSMVPPSSVLGLIDAPRSEQAKMKARLQTALNSFNVSSRQASFEADLVCCWSSMCNIEFDYKKDDTFEVALQKVLKVLRSRGIKIYNFNSNTTGASGEVDVLFLAYASEHRQCNSMQHSRIPGAPIFTGFTDTVEHIKARLSRVGGEVRLDGESVLLRRVIRAQIRREMRLDAATAEELVGIMAPAFIGSTDLGRWSDTLDRVKEQFKNTNSAVLSRYALILAAIDQAHDAHPGSPLYAWCICSADYLGRELYVAREALNGTLVVATPRGPHAHIVGYLAMTSQQSGTRLLETDEAGKMDLIFKVREVPGIGLTARGGFNAIPTTRLTAHFELEDKNVVAF